jgi:yecA family protein
MQANYQQVEEALRAVDAAIGAAEAQGLLAGMAGVADKPDKAAWIAQVLADTTPRGEEAKTCLGVLVALYEQTMRELDDDGMRFQPLLPADAAPLSQRAQELGRWASGFLAGVGLGGLTRDRTLPAEVGEALRDLDAITQVELDAAGGEQDESAYAELTEYVKVVALLVRANLRPPVIPTKSPQPDKRLH